MLINCSAYQEGNKIADIPVPDISEHLAVPGRFVWVALRDPSHDELAVMQEEFGLHELAVEDAMRGNQRPKVEEYGDSLFAVVKTLEPEGDDYQVGEVDIFIGPNFVLSSRRNSNQDFMAVRARAEREPELLRLGPSFVLYTLLDTVVDRYFPLAEALEWELEKIEERIFIRGSQRRNIERLYALKSKVLVLRHAVAPLMEAVGKLYGGRVPAMFLGAEEYFRDVHDHLFRLNGTLDTIRDTINTAIQVNLSMTAIEESEVNKKLAAWAAIFATFTAFAGIWGMNFEHMPELNSVWGYPAALGLMIGVAGYMYWRFRKAGWL
ncbi:magnesium/cobalt transporter CorA [Pseudoduganella sp. GCM10020061]|uniref:magnesium/cobalt transporter CorA n=1 Tax=Pseudoduganella sp. GCM10020061 TaxID=3317345 RepID=UPI00363EBEFD